MKITRNNYEAYVLDYLEGQLSNEGKAELFRFLEEHPDLAAEFDIDMNGLPLLFDEQNETEFPELKAEPNEMPKLIDEKLAAALEGDVEFPIADGNTLLEKHWKAMQYTKLPVELVSIGSKEALKVEGAEDQQTWLAAIAEGDVADGPLKAAALNDPHLSAELAYFKKAVLQPEAMSFGNLSTLKREPKVVPLFASILKYAAVAAAVIAAIAWFSLGNANVESTLYQAYNGGINSARTVVNSAEGSKTDSDVVQNNTTNYQYAHQSTSTDLPFERPQVKMNFAKQLQPKQLQLDYQKTENTGSEEERGFQNSANPPVKTYTVSAPKSKSFVPLKEYVIEKAKGKVLGESQSETEESFVRALTDKIEKSIQEKNSTKFKIQLPNKKKGQKFYFKLGKLEINQPSGVVEFIHGSSSANR